MRENFPEDEGPAGGYGDGNFRSGAQRGMKYALCMDTHVRPAGSATEQTQARNRGFLFVLEGHSQPRNRCLCSMQEPHYRGRPIMTTGTMVGVEGLLREASSKHRFLIGVFMETRPNGERMWFSEGSQGQNTPSLLSS